MTGYGRAAGPVGEGEAQVWARSVNHRSLDLTVRLRDGESALEPVVRRIFARRVARGKVDVTLRLKRANAAAYDVVVDEELLQTVLARLATLAAKFPIAVKLDARDLLAIPQVFSVEGGSAEFSPEELAGIERVADDAAAALVAMREVEGEGIGIDLLERIQRVREKAAILSARRGELTRTYYEALRARIESLVSGISLDPGRLEQEAALAADRSDISEELQRLQAHLEQFADLVRSAMEPVGKKLDFLSQEILRELNTLGSKARDLALVREVLEMKSELEKIREQIGNVE